MDKIVTAVQFEGRLLIISESGMIYRVFIDPVTNEVPVQRIFEIDL